MIRRWVAHNLSAQMLRLRCIFFPACLSLCDRSASENWCGSGMYLSSECPVLDTLHSHLFSWEVHEKEFGLLVLQHFEVWNFWQTGLRWFKLCCGVVTNFSDAKALRRTLRTALHQDSNWQQQLNWNLISSPNTNPQIMNTWSSFNYYSRGYLASG